MKHTNSCPFGHECQRTLPDNTLDTCRLYVEIEGQNPQNGEIEKKGNCALAWTPILLLEQARVARGTTAAVESFRNEVTDANARTAALLSAQPLLPALKP